MKDRSEQLICIALFSIALAAFAPFSTAADDSAQLALGKKVFERASCEGCHQNGNNVLHPNRPIKGAKFAARYKDDSVLEQVIRHGCPSAGMPPSGKHVINDKEMKALIAYIRSFTPKNAK
jgi:mono/diheme cytochrome c family protein